MTVDSPFHLVDLDREAPVRADGKDRVRVGVATEPADAGPEFDILLTGVADPRDRGWGARTRTPSPSASGRSSRRSRPPPSRSRRCCAWAAESLRPSGWCWSLSPTRCCRAARASEPGWPRRARALHVRPPSPYGCVVTATGLPSPSTGRGYATRSTPGPGTPCARRCTSPWRIRRSRTSTCTGTVPRSAAEVTWRSSGRPAIRPRPTCCGCDAVRPRCSRSAVPG